VLVIDEIDWSRVQTGAGRATDFPRQLAALLDPDLELRAGAVRYLWDEVMHSSTVWPAVPPVAQCLAAILGDPRMDRIVRVELLRWLRCAASDAVEEQEAFDNDGNASWAAEMGPTRAMLAARPGLYRSVVPLIEEGDDEERMAAITTVAELLAAPELEAERLRVTQRLLRLADVAPWRERAGIALALGRLGASPGVLLVDDDWGVRVCAAASRGLDDDPAAHDQLRETLVERRQCVNAHFGPGPHPSSATVWWGIDKAMRRRTGEGIAEFDVWAVSWPGSGIDESCPCGPDVAVNR
jgi:hypothetical protein